MNCKLHNFILLKLSEYLDGRDVVKLIINNISWLLIDKIIRMAVGMAVLASIARYLGPVEFGRLNYAMAFAWLFVPIASMGLQGVVVKELVRKPGKRDEILSSALILRFAGAIVAFIFAAGGAVYLKPNDIETVLLVTVFSLAMLPQVSEVIEYLYQSNLNVKIIVLIRNSAFLIFSLIKILIVLMQGAIVWFAIAATIESLVAAIALIILLFKSDDRPVLKYYGSEFIIALFKEGWPLIFSGISIAIYMRIDQMMLEHMLGNESVGLFSAVTRISEAWYFVPTAMVAAVSPALTKLHQTSESKYVLRLLFLMRILTWGSVFVAIIVTIFSTEIVSLIYGVRFQESATILSMHIWAGVFVGLGLVGGQWLTNAALLKYSLYQTVLGAAVNVTMNIILIPQYGPLGAAISTVASYAASAVFFNSLAKKCRPLFLLQMRTIFLWVK